MEGWPGISVGRTGQTGVPFLSLGVLLIGVPVLASPREVVTGSGDDSTSIPQSSTSALVLSSSG